MAKAVNLRVPFLDLRAHHEPLRARILERVARVIDQSAFAGGPFVAQFEQEFASYCGCPYAIGVGSGTDALWLTLLALGIGRGDEVITVPGTFMATAEAISHCGARPVFVDIDPLTYTMDPGQLERAITPRTRAIIPVHLFGQMADMEPILAIAEAHGLPVVEDACQAHGAEYRGHRAGTLGAAGCFSFYPCKNLGAWGEAGAVVTRDLELKEIIQMLRDHGQARKYHHARIGWNARMDGIQAVVLSEKLKQLDEVNAARRRNARHYARYLNGLAGVVLPEEAGYGRHVYHIYAVRVKGRDGLIAWLGQQGIGSGIHYPIPVHLQEAYRGLGYQPGAFPVAEQCAAEFVSLPMYPELTEAQIAVVAAAVVDWLRNSVPSSKAEDKPATNLGARGAVLSLPDE
jgi:dTDP-4-amino-4,6-dideoxygalactose transaminase